MRKVELEMVNAVMTLTEMRRDNTRVAVYYGGETVSGYPNARVFLHDNLIATLNMGPHGWELDVMDAGWQTATTKSRLNALLEGWGSDFRIFQRDHRWYIGKDGVDTPWKGHWTVVMGR